MSKDDPVNTAMEQILHHEKEATRLKQFVNQADALSGRKPRFESVGTEAVGAAPERRTEIKPGLYLGKPFAAAARLFFEMRGKAADGPSPASVDEIHAGLTAGTFAFKGTAEEQKQSIRISLGKNSAMFVKLPNTDLFGLAEWYPGLKKGKAK